MHATCIQLLEPGQISMVAKRGHTNRANVHTPLLKKKLFKNTARQNCGCNWINKNADAQVLDDVWWDQKLETFFFEL